MKEFMDLINSQDNCIYVQTYEEREFINELCECLNKGLFGFRTSPKKVNFYVYNRPSGLKKYCLSDPDNFERQESIKGVNNYGQLFGFIEQHQTQEESTPAQESLSSIFETTFKDESGEDGSDNLSQDPCNIFILEDLHLYMDKDVIRSIRNLKEAIGDKYYSPIICTCPVINIPPELEKLFTYFEYTTMDMDDIRTYIKSLADAGYVAADKVEETCLACMGLTAREISRAVLHSLTKFNCVSAKVVHDEKIQLIKKSGALDYLTPSSTIEDFGGYENLKSWIREMKTAMSPEAKKFGLQQPKGAMFVGIAGCGKSKNADVIANYLGVPLLSLDLAKVMGSFVGQSERQISNALRIAKACAPCVLLIDECEKLFGGRLV